MFANAFFRRTLLGLMVSSVGMVHAVGQAPSAAARRWADSVLASLSLEQRIAQLLVVRTSTQGPGGQAVFFDSATLDNIRRYNIGAVCLFQGRPEQQASLLNRMQVLAMRFAGVQPLPYQLTLGATGNEQLVYQVGRAIGLQCRRMNIHVNYAPVVDINNNPANPVIGVRSFGQDKELVALLGTRIMQGMQDAGVMACAKHFPGHGDVSVDSHYDLPFIPKPMADLEALELHPFRPILAAGVGGLMIPPLTIPAIDSTPNRPTSLSAANINQLLRKQMGYQGLSFTDALEMQGVAKFYPSGEAAVQSIIAGNDMLCLPASVPQTIAAVKKAIEEGRLTTQDIDQKCLRVLLAKHAWVLGKNGMVSSTNLLPDLNMQTQALRQEVARQALTAVRLNPQWQPLAAKATGVAYVAIGGTANMPIAGMLAKHKVKMYYLPLQATARAADSLLKAIQKANHSQVLVGLHGLGRSPASNFGIGPAAMALVQQLAPLPQPYTLMVFGNPYSLALFEKAGYQNVLACYEDDAAFQQAAYAWLTGSLKPTGRLPVTVGSYPYGHGIGHRASAALPLPSARPLALGLRPDSLQRIDSIMAEAINKGATPGGVVTVVRRGRIAYQKAYGFLDEDKTMPTTLETVYDMASVTKIMATTLSIMKLLDDSLINLTDPIGKYLTWLKGTNKEGLTIENLLLHQAGLSAFIPFYKEVTLPNGEARPGLFARQPGVAHPVVVSNNLYLQQAWPDTMRKRIAQSPLVTNELKYVYSDNDFILLGLLVEAVSGLPLHQFAHRYFYEPMGLQHTLFRPYEKLPLQTIAPTEREPTFRQELIWGHVHDPGAAMFGNVAGHAGLFSRANDLALLAQMLLNGGSLHGRQYLNPQTVACFTSYQTPISRRGLGFDKPEKDNHLRTPDKAYPAKYPSALTYGHTGFTGTCVWIDPQEELVFIFLSNRVHPAGGDNRKLLDLNIRGRIHDAIYKAITAAEG